MANTVAAVAQMLRALVSLAILGILGTGGWFVWRQVDQRNELSHRLEQTEAELAKQTAAVERLTVENEKLQLALRLLKVDHRVARIDVLDQTTEPGRGQTKFEFVELTSGGEQVGEAKPFVVDGQRIFVEAWVVKFADESVERGDPLAGTSVCLFRGLFGEFQEPSEAFPLDQNGSRPSVYSQGYEVSPLEKDVWANFWEYANNPAKLKAAGLRAVHAEAPSIRMMPGKRYRLELRASGGLSIIAEDRSTLPQ